ncbi:unnamed protein product [Paramecium octaurelia]|uniref:Uncharacterized protein n=1 Tax=Paramecium octaurelia TaxID=43137 RepID=A0A8S1Y102_PAROT|nr:unnamed protein product [Paramecium octaurelia]
MNTTIRKLYTFKKKQKSFDKTFGAKYVQDLLNNIVVQKIDFSATPEICKTEEDLDLDDLIIHDISKTEGPEEDVLPIDDLSQKLNDLVSPRKKLVTFDSDNYRLIYRLKKSKSKLIVVPCKVSKRTFKMTDQDLQFQQLFDQSNFQFQPPNELDFLIPFNDFYQKINEIVLNQL